MIPFEDSEAPAVHVAEPADWTSSLPLRSVCDVITEMADALFLAVMLQGKRLAVRADPGQLEQVIINLAVNARDAMSKGGVLGIETDVVALNEHDVIRLALDPMTATQPARPGEYALVRVTDTGAGMDPDVMKHSFEPFFTTSKASAASSVGDVPLSVGWDAPLN
ncbi:MAG: ATP-binding protein [Gemmatimonadaceae bacterium]